MKHASSPSDDTRLHALADGRAIPAGVGTEPLGTEAEARVRDWQLQRGQLRALHADLAHTPPPEPRRASAERLQTHLDAQAAWLRWGGMAAAWLLAFGLGWFMHGYNAATAGPSLAQAVPTGFVRQAAWAHAVYQPEQRHPVEVGAAQQDHLVQWLSKRLGRPLKVPVLSTQGFELVGGRLLPGDASARAQFMYQNAAGQRVTLYLGALPETAAKTPAQFSFHAEGPVSSFYWVDDGFGYALSGDLPREVLLTLATAIHQQL